MKIITYNVNGIRAAVKKNFLEQVEILDPDIICIQETKAQDDQVAEALRDLEGYHLFSTSAEKKGYSGVAILTKKEPLGTYEGIETKEHDNEGRVFTVEYDDFMVVNVYVPNSGNGLKRLNYREAWDQAFAEFLAELRAEKPIIVTGDFNVAHMDIDLARPKQNYNKTAGYTQVEIDGLDNILTVGLVDSFRQLYPDKVEYTYWSFRGGNRERNVGWRIDYFLVDTRLMASVERVEHFKDYLGSDHCPVMLTLNQSW